MVWKNLRTGAIHQTLKSAISEAEKVYGWPLTGVLFNELYVATFL